MEIRTHWQIQKAVFHALLIRELRTRFGRYRLGYLWAILEPLSHVVVLSTLFSLIRSESGFYDAPFPVFFATGVLSYFFFQKVVLTSLNSIKVNLGLFGFRQVKPFDAIVVRAFIEGGILLSTIIVLAWLGAWFFNLPTIPADPLKALVILFLLFMFGLGVGFFAAIIGTMHEEWGQLINLSMRPLYILSGIFFPLAALPEKYHAYLLWNPLLHAVEQFRAAWIAGYPADKTSIMYVVAWCLPALLLGLNYYRNNRTRVLML